MRTSLDSYLGIHPQALALEAQRNQLLAANLANVDTPNYKARDIDFKSALASAGAGAMSAGSTNLPLSATNTTLPVGAIPPAPTSAGDSEINATALKYRVPMAPALDGNTVDEQLEQSAFAENNVRYQATLAFLNAKLRDVMTAITGS